MNDDLILNDSPQPSRADAVKNRALLLETARRLFTQKSVENVSMKAIAEAAGVGKGTLYRHFENKSQLCHALLDQETRDLQESSLRRLQNQGAPTDDLVWFVEQVAHFVIRNLDLLFIEEPELRVIMLAHPAHLWWRQTIRGLLGRIKPSGELDLDYTSDMIYVMLDARTIYFQMRVIGYDDTRIINGLQAVVRQIAH